VKIQKEINGQRVIIVEDYQSSMARNLLDDSEIKMAIPKSNVLIYYTEDGSKFVRDQAERSQNKIYISVNTILDDVEDLKSKLF
jgi:hypothetical protein